MSISIDDLKHLRWSLLLLAVVIVLGATGVFALSQVTGSVAQENRKLLSQVSDIRNRLSRVREEEEDIRRKIDRYRDLVTRGIIGPEARLDWMEQIARIKSERRLPGIDYEILPQAPIAADLLPPAPGPYEFMASPMRLRLALLHENDLLDFLDDLDRSLGALVVIRECRIERAPVDNGHHDAAAQLQAECLLDLITLRDKS